MLVMVYPMLLNSTAYTMCMRKMYREAFTVSMDPIITTTTVGGGAPDVPMKALNWSCRAEYKHYRLCRSIFIFYGVLSGCHSAFCKEFLAITVQKVV